MMYQFLITKSKQTHLANVITQILLCYPAPPVSHTLTCSLSLIYFLNLFICTLVMSHWRVQPPPHRTVCLQYHVPLLITLACPFGWATDCTAPTSPERCDPQTLSDRRYTCRCWPQGEWRLCVFCEVVFHPLVHYLSLPMWVCHLWSVLDKYAGIIYINLVLSSLTSLQSKDTWITNTDNNHSFVQTDIQVIY